MPNVVLRCVLLLLSLFPVSCAGIAGNQQGPLQPQAVTGPCTVHRFFLSGLRSVPVEMTVRNIGQVCAFTLVNPDLQYFFSAALVTEAGAHGSARAALVSGGRQVTLTYRPEPGYAGSDRFDVTIEPNAIGMAVKVNVQNP